MDRKHVVGVKLLLRETFFRARDTGSTGVVHGPAYCTPTRDLHETSTRYYSTNIDAIKAALEDLKLLDTKNISVVAKLHKVQRSTLSRRWRGVTNLAKIKH